MVEPAYIIIEKDISVNLSKVIETAAINTPLRNLLNVQKRSIDDADLNSSQSILLKKYVIKTLMVNCSDKCDYTHCIRLFKSGEYDDDEEKTKHQIKCHSMVMDNKANR